jgi:hypothetical protein
LRAQTSDTRALFLRLLVVAGGHQLANWRSSPLKTPTAPAYARALLLAAAAASFWRVRGVAADGVE